MTGSASQRGQEPVRAKQQADGGVGPTSSLIIAAVAHAGVFAWKLSDGNELPPLRLPYGNLIAIACAAALLVIFLIAAFGRRGSLSFVVVPAMIVAGIAAHAVSAVMLPEQAQGPVVVGVLGFGALSVALTLSFGAAAIASSVAPAWSEAPFTRSNAFRVGVVALVLVLIVAHRAGSLAPIAGLCSAVGLIVLAAMLNAVARDPRSQGPAVSELVSSFSLSIGACWVAAIVAATAVLARAPYDWHATQVAMRYAWLSAMPLVLAAVVGILPRVEATGLGVKRGVSTVFATTIGALTCAGLGQVVLIQATPKMLHPAAAFASASASQASAPAATPKAPADATASPQPPPEAPTSAPASASASATPASSASGSPVVAPAAGDPENALALESEHSRVTLEVKVDGPMLPRDARAGSAKTMKRLIECYENHGPRGEPAELKLGLTIDTVGSVKQVDVLDREDPRDKYTTCIQMAFYRSGFSGGPRSSSLEIDVSFAPKG